MTSWEVITILRNTDHKNIISRIDWDMMVYPVPNLCDFEFRFGKLP